MGKNMGKIQVYNKKFQNSKLNKISFWLKQVFIEKNNWFLLRGNNHSVTLFQFMQFPGLAYGLTVPNSTIML